MDEFLILLQAKLDEAKSKGNVNADIDKIQGQIDKLKIQAEIDPKTISNLVKQLESALNQKINISNIGINSSNTIKAAQQTGQQIGNAINQGITNAVSKANSTLKSFSELKIGTGNIDAVLDKNGILDIEQSLTKIKQIYSEFGQVRITNKLFDPEGNLQKFRVEIQQVNGDLKESRSFMMALADSGKSFGFPEDVIRGSENFVHHLNEAKKVTNEVLTEEQKLANVMGDVREKTEQSRKAEEQRQQLAQNNAINKALKEEYQERLKVAEATKAQVDKIQLSLDNGHGVSEYQNRIQSLINDFQKYGVTVESAKTQTSSLQQIFKNMKGLSGRELVAQADKFEQEFKAVKISIDEAKLSYDKLLQPITSSKQVNLTNKIEKWLVNNTRATKSARQELELYLKELSSGSINQEQYTNFSNRLTEIDTEMRSMGKLGKSLFQSLSDGMQKFTSWLSATAVVMKIITTTKQAISSVKELDTALVDLKKTTSMSNKELEEFYYSSNDVAKQMGVTTEEIINQAAAWSRLGYSSAEAATKMAKYSSMFASISPGMDIDAATDGLVSMMKAYNIGNDNPDEVLDGIMSKINIIGNTAATSNAEIVNMLSKSSSAMAEANNTLEETIALETAAVEITRDDDSVGTAFKTIAMRIRGYDEETEEYIGDIEELDGTIANLTKTASTPGGISLFTDDTKSTYKSTYQLLKEISEIYNQLSDKDQAGLLEALAGKRQGQIVAATINNFEAVEKALDNMANSAGSAEAEMSVIMDSLDYKLNILKEIGTGIAQNLFKKDDMKSVVDVLNSFMGILDKVTEKLGLFGTLTAGVGLFAGLKNVGMA